MNNGAVISWEAGMVVILVPEGKRAVVEESEDGDTGAMGFFVGFYEEEGCVECGGTLACKTCGREDVSR